MHVASFFVVAVNPAHAPQPPERHLPLEELLVLASGHNTFACASQSFAVSCLQTPVAALLIVKPAQGVQLARHVFRWFEDSLSSGHRSFDCAIQSFAVSFLQTPVAVLLTAKPVQVPQLATH